MNILIIGMGNMGETYARSLLHSRIVDKEHLFLLEKSPEKGKLIEEKNIGTVHPAPGPYIKEADLIILAVKPQDTKSLFPMIKEFLDPDRVLLSIMAGVSINRIAEELGTKKVIRAMPNLPAQVGMGMTVYTSSKDVTRLELVTVQNILNATGKAIYVNQENQIDAATAISGSGPAYVFYFMNTMIDAALDLGIGRSEAALMVFQTFRGAIELFNKNDLSCKEWIQKVASRGGTTEAALQTFQEENLNKNMLKGIQSAFKRATELSD